MKLLVKLYLRFPDTVFIPAEKERKLLNGVIYSVLGLGDRELAQELHGATKLHSFACLDGKEKNGMRIIPQETVWQITFADTRVAEKFLTGLEKKGMVIRLGNNLCNVEKVVVEDNTKNVTGRRVKFRTLSPVAVIMKVPGDNGRTKNIYINYFKNPFKYNEILQNIVVKRYVMLYGEYPADRDFSLFFMPQNAKYDIYYYDDITVYATEGWGFIEGNPELIKVAVKAGVGNKTALGFGFIEVVPVQTYPST